VETATKLFGLIVRARNHAQLREAMSCTLCVCATSPALLHAFLYLQLNFITAVSSIITVSDRSYPSTFLPVFDNNILYSPLSQVDPTTHKDHITLAAALGFLQTSFAALLAQESSLPGQLAEEVVAYHNETSAAILAHMTAYFAAHFQQANTFFVGLTAASETEKEHATASHAVCSAYFHLLHTLSAFRLPGLQLGAHMTGNLITSLLVHIAISELHRAHDRAVALSTLENLVRFHGGGWQAVASCGNPHLTSIFGERLCFRPLVPGVDVDGCSGYFITQEAHSARRRSLSCAARARTASCAMPSHRRKRLPSRTASCAMPSHRRKRLPSRTTWCGR
jgi:hypothetical protein